MGSVHDFVGERFIFVILLPLLLLLLLRLFLLLLLLFFVFCLFILSIVQFLSFLQSFLDLAKSFHALLEKITQVREQRVDKTNHILFSRGRELLQGLSLFVGVQEGLEDVRHRRTVVDSLVEPTGLFTIPIERDQSTEKVGLCDWCEFHSRLEVLLFAHQLDHLGRLCPQRGIFEDVAGLQHQNQDGHNEVQVEVGQHAGLPKPQTVLHYLHHVLYEISRQGCELRGEHF
mmetsp:Transcript_1676/g.3446  ORF Transcript_1676/g.3446 Transcript_1676/m.3446 type:complete len:230 (-) Transcript_1676:1945-2634(-)